MSNRSDAASVPPMSLEQQARFWSYVQVGHEDECWPWLRAKSSRGYGRYRVGQRDARAHRAAYALAVRDPGAMNVLHRCDNPPCCNPHHLWLGTHADNRHDAIRKERARYSAGDDHYAKRRPDWVARGERHGSRTQPSSRARGERVGSARLTEQQVLMVRQMRRAGATQKAVAKQFGVSRGCIDGIDRNLNWKHIPGDVA